MNDIQAKENILNSANATVEKENASLSDSTKQLTVAQNTYLQSVIRAAILSEKLRRKKDNLSKLVVWGTCAIIALILLIQPIMSIIFIVIVGLIALLVNNQNSEAKTINYNDRKEFFTKYAQHIPSNEKLKWKNSTITYTGTSIPPTTASTTATQNWSCPKCSTQNKAESNFCVSCGNKKPE